MKIDNINAIKAKLEKIKVKEIMSRHAITTMSYTPIVDVAHLLMRFKVSGVPVVDGDKKIIGIVTATDLFEVMKNIVNTIDVEPKQQKDYPLFVKDIMINDVFTIDEEDDVLTSLKLMCTHNIHTLPVKSGNDLVGVIGRRDVLNSFYGQ